MFIVGPSGIEPDLHPPHGRVLPVYYGPDCTILPYTKDRRLGGPGCFVESLDAIGADLDPLTVYFCPLEVWIPAGFVGRIVVTAQKHTGGDHDGLLSAIGTSGCHMIGGLKLGLHTRPKLLGFQELAPLRAL